MRLGYHGEDPSQATGAYNIKPETGSEAERLLKKLAQSGNVDSMRELGDLLTTHADEGYLAEGRVREGLLWYENAAACLDQKAKDSWEALTGRKLRVVNPKSNYVILHAALSILTVLCLLAARYLKADLVGVCAGLFVAWQLSLAAFEVYYAHELAAADQKSEDPSRFFRPGKALMLARLVTGLAVLIAGYGWLVSKSSSWPVLMMFLLFIIAINMTNFLLMLWTKRRERNILSNLDAVAEQMGFHNRKFAELSFILGVVSTLAVGLFATYWFLN